MSSEALGLSPRFEPSRVATQNEQLLTASYAFLALAVISALVAGGIFGATQLHYLSDSVMTQAFTVGAGSLAVVAGVTFVALQIFPKIPVPEKRVPQARIQHEIMYDQETELTSTPSNVPDENFLIFEGDDLKNDTDSSVSELTDTSESDDELRTESPPESSSREEEISEEKDDAITQGEIQKMYYFKGPKLVFNNPEKIEHYLWSPEESVIAMIPIMDDTVNGEPEIIESSPNHAEALTGSQYFDLGVRLNKKHSGEEVTPFLFAQELFQKGVSTFLLEGLMRGEKLDSEEMLDTIERLVKDGVLVDDFAEVMNNHVYYESDYRAGEAKLLEVLKKEEKLTAQLKLDLVKYAEYAYKEEGESIGFALGMIEPLFKDIDFAEKLPNLVKHGAISQEFADAIIKAQR